MTRSPICLQQPLNPLTTTRHLQTRSFSGTKTGQWQYCRRVPQVRVVAQGKLALFSFRMPCLTALYLQSRSFRGLEARVGEDAPSMLEQGRSGIARGYADDHPTVDESHT